VDGVGRWYLGAPKTVRGRRQVRIGEATRQALLRRSTGKSSDALVFTGTRGGPLDQPHFYEYRWQRAVALAQRNGLTKKPRFHDLRRSYGGWLKSANVPLPEIQARMGHESITTTADVYSGVLDRTGDLADAALDTALDWVLRGDDQEPGMTA
jgi:integrase